MSDTVRSSTLHRISHTPMRDLVRGRITGRLDVKTQINAAELPEPATSLVLRIVLRTRLWPLEKVDVAAELIAHFADGLEAGATADQLIRSFGDERAAAKLIHRAKKRNRPLTWHVLRIFGWMVLALVAIYAISAIRFYTGRPAPSIDYVDLLNANNSKLAPEQKAWPLYRKAILAFGPQATDPSQQDWTDRLDAKPDQKNWPKLVTWLNEHRADVDLLRDASRKPALGFTLGRNGSSVDPELWPDSANNRNDDSFLISMALPHLNSLRLIARVLDADGRLAIEHDDSQRLLGDVQAMVRLADQLDDANNFSITELVALSIRSLAVDTIDFILSREEVRLRNADLQQLAHLFAKPDTAAELMSFKGERMFFYDTIQRIYTDNGQGDGCMTRRGLELLGGLTSTVSSDGKVLLAIPLASPIGAASRRDVLRKYDYFMNMAEANLHRPLREEQWDQWNREFLQFRSSLINDVQFLPIMVLMPSLHRAHLTAERYLGMRDGVLCGIALEVYKRQHGSYPDSLDALSPILLPAIPSDRIVGGPVHYRLVDGHPVIYSFGADGDDDGGRPPMSKNGMPDNYSAADVAHPPSQVPDGDWVLYPRPRMVTVENDNE